MRKGFTLVELAIVFVIIGLLIGGILVGQSMISTARVENYVRTLQQYNIAYTNFTTTYNAMPGDTNIFQPQGNANRTMDGVGCNGVYNATERFQVWAHLSEASMIKDTYLPSSSTFCGGTQPVSPFDSTGVISPLFAKSPLMPSFFGYATDKITVSFFKNPSYRFYTDLPPYDTIAVDAKLDDGKGATGQFHSNEFNDGDPCEVYLSGGGNPDTTLCEIFWNPDPQ